MSTLTLLVATSALTASLAAPATAEGADAPTGKARYCHGKRATIVGTPTRPLSGTPRADVIVSHDASSVDGLGGDDLICVTGARPQGTDVDAGAGDDLIDASASQTGVHAKLGPGDDTFIGSAQGDYVDALDHGTDHVSMGGGADEASAGGTAGHRDHDVVHLGSGDDTMPTTALDPSTRWYGDAGDDSMDLPFDPHAQDDWVYDDVRHGVYRNRVLVRRFRGFETFTTGTVASAHSLTFRGGPQAEVVHVAAELTGQLRVNLGGGDDTAQVVLAQDDPAPGVPRYVLTGGSGHDRFDAIGLYTDDLADPVYSKYVSVDLVGHTVGTVPDGPSIGSLKGFEDVGVTHYYQADLTGDDHDNQLLATQSCQGHLIGGAGDDVLSAGVQEGYDVCDANADSDPGQPMPGATLEGGPGNDTLTGGAGDDTLVGGPDADSADGSAGTDICDAETTINCEA